MSGGWQQTSLGEPHIAFLQRRPFHPFPISSDLVILYIVFNLDVKAVTKKDQRLFYELLVNPSRLTKRPLSSGGTVPLENFLVLAFAQNPQYSICLSPF